MGYFRIFTRAEQFTMIFQEHYLSMHHMHSILRICFSSFVHAVSIQNLVMQGGCTFLEDVTWQQERPLKCHLLLKRNIGVLSNATLSSSSFFVTTFTWEDPLVYYVYELIPKMNNGSQLLACARLLKLTGYMVYARTCVSVHVLVWDI
jgi:hypothetical protein